MSHPTDELVTGRPIGVPDDASDFLAVGHVTRDLRPDSPRRPGGVAANATYTLGGTVSFAAITAHQLGHRPAVVTRAAEDLDLAPLRRVAALTVLPSPTSTTFDNIYTESGRIQYVYTPAGTISAADLGTDLRRSPVALLGPLVNEVRPDVAACFAPHTLVGAVPQGWMRRWDADGRVHPVPWQSASEILPFLDVLILSIEDIAGDLNQIDVFLQQVPLVIMTQYREGSTVYRRSDDGTVQVIRVPPRPAREVDPTGAGDIFATAFLLRYRQIGSAPEAARYANVAASFGVEGIGVTGIPSHAMVIEYMKAHPWSWIGEI